MTESAPRSDPTPHWQRIRRTNPEAHMALQRVAEAIYERTEEPVQLEGFETSLSVATERGLLASTDQGVSFVDPHVRRDYLIRHMTSTVLPSWGEASRFAGALADAQRRTSKYAVRRAITAAVLLVLAREHRKDVVGLAGELVKSAIEGGRPDRFFWGLYSAICEALPELEIEPVRLAEVVAALSEATGNDSAAGSLHNALEKLAARSSATGDALYEIFASSPDSRLVNFLPAVLVGLAGSNFDEAHRRALGLSWAGEPAARRAGIAALGFFNYSGVDHDRLLEATWERLERGRLNPDPKAAQALVYAYGNLLDRKKPGVTGALIDFSARRELVVQGPVAAILFQRSDEAYAEPWFREALLNLAGAPTSSTSVWENLDHALFPVAQRAPDLAVAFMEAAVVGRDYGSDDKEDELPKMLPGALVELAQNHPGALEETVTRWFASSDRRLHRAARDLVHETYDVTGRSEPWLRLSKKVLDELDEQTVVYALQRIMGLVMGSRALAALLLSATRREPCSTAFLTFVAEALGGYVLRNFPHEAGEYLRQQLEASDIEEAEGAVARAALERSDAYLAAVDGLPRLKEFQPSSQRLYLLRLAEHRQQNGMMDRAKQSSVLLNIMPELPLKYGRSHFMERDDGGFTEPSELVPFSISAEKPRAEILDPVGLMFLRLGWQSAGLPDSQDADNSYEESQESGEGAGR